MGAIEVVDDLGVDIETMRVRISIVVADVVGNDDFLPLVVELDLVFGVLACKDCGQYFFRKHLREVNFRVKR